MDTKTLVAETLLALKDGLGAAWSKLSADEQQLVKDVAEEGALASIAVLTGESGAKDRLDRAKASASAVAFGGALIAKGMLEEKLMAALGKGIQLLLGLALAKL